jgi:hypothetical protein
MPASDERATRSHGSFRGTSVWRRGHSPRTAWIKSKADRRCRSELEDGRRRAWIVRQLMPSVDHGDVDANLPNPLHTCRVEKSTTRSNAAASTTREKIFSFTPSLFICCPCELPAINILYWQFSDRLNEPAGQHPFFHIDSFTKSAVSYHFGQISVIQFGFWTCQEYRLTSEDYQHVFTGLHSSS